MKKAFLLIFSVVFFTWTRAQDTAACMRRAYQLTIPVNKKVNYDQELPAGSFLLADGSLLMYTGETVNLEVTLRDGVVERMKPVCTVSHPEITLIFSVTHLMEKKMHKMVMLKVVNPFPLDLEYKAYFQQLDGTRFEPTSTLPVMAKRAGYETWPNFIIALALRDITLRAR